MQPEAPPGALRLQLDADALRANWQALDRLSGKASAAAAVKANGYGLGAGQVTQILQKAGCADFFVAHWSEVSDLVGLVDPARISVFHGPLSKADTSYAKAIGVKPVINTVTQATSWLEGGNGPCDIMVDTGINRLGLAMSDLGNEAVKSLDVDILMSHLASADEDVPLNDLQRRRWDEARASLPHRRASLANSAGIVLGEAYHGDLTRPGLALYGGIPREELAGEIRQVARPQAALMQIRDICAGDGLGYNSTFIAKKPMRVGTIALGYADGYLRCWSGKGEMVSGSSRLPVLGQVSMDMTLVDLASAPELQEGDWVEAPYMLRSAAAASGLSQYELLTLLGQRFAR